MKKFFGILSMLTVLSACGPRYMDYYPYHEDGRAKPCVAVFPIQDHSYSEISWDLGQELDQKMNYRLMDDGVLFVVPEEVGIDKTDYFTGDYSFVKHCNQADFVIVMDLVEHKKIPYGKGKIYPLYPIHNKECDSVLMMKMRVRILDVRGNEPAIVLQEIHQSNHMLPRGRDQLENCISWGTDAYARTPIGLAHQQMMNDITRRCEKVIQSAALTRPS